MSMAFPADNNDQLPRLEQAEIEQYLASGIFHGIGKKTAALLAAYFGSDTLEVLEFSPQRLKLIPGLYPSRINVILSAWEKSKSNPVRGTQAWLLGMGISLGLTLKLTDYYEQNTASVLKTNPYQIIDDLDGIGFKIADSLALKLGMPPDSPRRYEQGILQTLQDARNQGHCFLPSSELTEAALGLLSCPGHTPNSRLLNQVLENALAQKVVVEGRLSESLYLKPIYRAEVNVARLILYFASRRQLSIEPLEEWLQQREAEAWRSSGVLDIEQRQALLRSYAQPISIITGGAGRGKTHILKYLIDWLTKCRFKVALAAPTGKAATRMKNATKLDAQTIHRLLQWRGHGQRFEFNQENPLQIDWLIIDEFSMVDIFLFNSLLKALEPHTRIVLVGDHNQLPSVGAGMVLRDLLISEVVPCSRLKKIYRQRQESPIIYAAEDVISGVVPNLQRFYSPQQWQQVSDCAILCRHTPEEIADTIVELVAQMQRDQVDLKNQVMVLAPQKNGVVGVHALNQRLQPLFNPKQPEQPEVQTGDVVYRVGDRVIQLKNRYDTKPAVMNGEGGWVIEVQTKSKPEWVKVAFEGGAVVNYFPGIFEQIMHSFCLTCHKAQGSEFQYVIMPLSYSNQRMLSRQLLYTTMTRASYGGFIAVGRPDMLRFAVNVDKPLRRYTQLPLLLSESYQSLMDTLNQVRTTQSSAAQNQRCVSVAMRLRELNIDATKGEKTSIGSLALQLYQSQYGRRPSKRLEVIEPGQKFKTYHYETEAIELLDRAIKTIMKRDRD